MRLKKHIGVLYSGGLDSAALIGFYLKKGFSVWPIFVKAGLPWESTELFWCKKFLNAIKSPRLQKISMLRISLENAYNKNWSIRRKFPGSKSPDKAVYLPARNLLLISKAILILYPAKVPKIAIGTLKGNPFPDGKRSYFDLLQKILSRSIRQKIKILTPFRHLHKFQVIKMSKNFPLQFSFSCLAPRGKYHCGKCNKCAERKKAFKKAAIKDLTIYKNK